MSKKEVNLQVKSVGNIIFESKRFVIPSYQRGYRWEDEEVHRLLDDLSEYESYGMESPPFYCLQPLVVLHRLDAERKLDEWEVVDGQQRLTTIYLILNQLDPEGAPHFHIQYERHPETKEGLQGLLQSLSAGNQDYNSPDIYFIKKAEEAIKKWFDAHQGTNLPSLTNQEGACAKFIWYEIESRKEAIRTFSRLNGGKIRLMDSELIRALFLKQGKLAKDERHQIALRWDQIEIHLQNNEFWSFLNVKDANTKIEEDKSDARIGLIFSTLARTKRWPENVNRDRDLYERFFIEMQRFDDRKKLWQEIDDLFGVLEGWFENNQLFHLIGFLIEQRKPIPDLLEQSYTLEKDAFVKYLKKEIRCSVLPAVDSKTDIRAYLKGVRHGKDTKVIEALLLCLNLATLDADKTDTVRFSFHAYKQGHTWDIEHIRATASRPPEGKGELLAALRVMLFYWCPTVDDQNQIQHNDLDILDTVHNDSKSNMEIRTYLLHTNRDAIEPYLEGIVNDAARAQLYKRLCEVFEEQKELEVNDGLENLTLLDSGTNRGYGNSPFQVKRSWVLELDQQAKYLLPCTRNVFTKAYSKEPINLLHWSEPDANDYLAAITDRLGRFFEDTWGTPS